MSYAEFISPPKPSIGLKDACSGFQGIEISWSNSRYPLPLEVYSSSTAGVGHATPSGRSVRHFVKIFDINATHFLIEPQAAQQKRLSVNPAPG